MGYTAGREGNLRNDSFHSYTWDAFGGVTAIDSYPITHDAFGRIVEFKSSPTYQILYAPTGADVAVMNGQTIFYGSLRAHTPCRRAWFCLALSQSAPTPPNPRGCNRSDRPR